MSRAAPPAAHRHWRLGPAALAARPRFTIALAIGLAVGGACAVLAPALSASSCGIAGWDAFCFAYLGLTLSTVIREGPVEIRARAAIQDEGQAVILLLILAACAASLAAAGVELSQARRVDGLERAVRVAAAVVTLVGSWLVMQTAFALHYAHEYYAAAPESRDDVGGLAFPGGQPPDYWDFLHFSIVIGVASQTADIAFTDRRLRRLGTLHSLVAFVFNTLILALTINLVAGLF